MTKPNTESAILLLANSLETLKKEREALRKQVQEKDRAIDSVFSKMRGILGRNLQQDLYLVQEPKAHRAPVERQTASRSRGARPSRKRACGTIEFMYRSNGYTFLGRRLNIGKIDYRASGNNGTKEVIWLSKEEYKQIKRASDHRYKKAEK